MVEVADIVIRGGRLVDPANGIDGLRDIAIRNGRVVEVSEEITAPSSRVLSASGLYVVPGLVDTHVHLSPDFNGAVGHAMLARAGVTTALDLAGPVGAVLGVAAANGAGLSIACLDSIRPRDTVPTDNPGRGQIRDAIDRALENGAIGVKVLGGHFPLTPEATAMVFEAANNLGAYVAFHAGTTATGSDINGLEEALMLAGGNKLHLAHINSYCRGTVDTPLHEAQKAITLLRSTPWFYSESYLAPINGTWADCVNGAPISQRTRACLETLGFAPSESGLERAIVEGEAQVHLIEGDAVVLRTGLDAASVWKEMGTRTAVSFAVNPPEPRLLLALSKGPTGGFDVDALATDGGGIPRNDAVSSGLALVDLGAISLSDWVTKVSLTPARAMGLARKGHLSAGADADIALIDPAARVTTTTIARGSVVMHRGLVTGTGSTWLGPPRSIEKAVAAGCAFEQLEVANAGFFDRDGL